MSDGVRDAQPPTRTSVGVGVLGYGFMGRAHTFAYQRIPMLPRAPITDLRLLMLGGRTEARVAAAATQWGYARHCVAWQEMVEDPAITLLDNCTVPYMHADPSLAAIRRGKHVLCEKPLAPTLAEARAMRDAAAESSAKTMCGFNYRFLPAIRLARDLVRDGSLGDIYLFRAHYLQEGWHTPSRPAFVGPEAVGRGALASIGSHVIDLARFLVGDIASVQSLLRTKVPSRPHPYDPAARVACTNDETVQALVEFASGATGSLEASSVAMGRKNYLSWELNGSRGSARFNLERLNELEVCLPPQGSTQVVGCQQVLVTEPDHPFISQWWPRGHTLGWEHTFIHEIQHLLTCIVQDRPIGPEGATFEDGYQAARISEAMTRSAAEGRKISIQDVED
jgi:predicted dehydrogenase